MITLGMIILNSISLAVEDPTTDQIAILQKLDYIFLSFYTFEMIIKIIGMGFAFKKGAYLRSAWNILDFIIVCSGLLQLYLENSSIKLGGLRAFRILRPLKTISGIEGLRVIVTALITSSQNLIEAFVVLYIGYLIFSITGLQLFMGQFKKRCINIETGIQLDDDLCGVRACPDGFFCGKVNSNPNFEQSNFDTIFYSFISVYQSVSLEGWTLLQIYAQKSYTMASWAFFCPMTFIVSYFLIQLTQAVISNAFQNSHSQNEQGDQQNKKKKKKVLKDFENLDEKERQQLLEEQEESRREIIKKWRRIYTVKSGLLRFIHAFKRKKKEQAKENEKMTNRYRNRHGILKFLNSVENLSKKTEQEQKSNIYHYDSQTSLKHQTAIHRNEAAEKKFATNTTDKSRILFNSYGLSNNQNSSPDRAMKMLGIAGIQQAERLEDNFASKKSIELNLKELTDQICMQSELDENDAKIIQDIQYGLESSGKYSPSSYHSLDRDAPQVKYIDRERELQSPNFENSSDSKEVQTPIKSSGSTQNSNQLKAKSFKSSLDDLKEERVVQKQNTGSPERFKNLHDGRVIIKKGMTQDLKKQDLSAIAPEGTSYFAHLRGNQSSNMNDVTSFLGRTHEGPHDTNKTQATQIRDRKRYFGTKTTAIRDYIPVEESILNYKEQVKEDIGEHKKIYLRQDKLDFIKPSIEIFEQRERQQKEQEYEEAIKESVNYQKELKVKPWQKKVYNGVLEVIPNDDQVEVLAQLGLEPMDLEDLIQGQYNKFYISNLYITGTLSITIQNKAPTEQKLKVRQFKSQNLMKEENENIQALYLVEQFLKFNQYSQAENAQLSMDKSSVIAFQSEGEGASQNKSRKHKKSMLMRMRRKTRQQNSDNQSNLRRRIQRSRMAAKDAELNKKMIISKLTKDAVRSQLMRHMIIRTKFRDSRLLFFPDVPDSDEENQHQEEEDDAQDEFLDLTFDCNIEIMKAKKQTLAKKILRGQWSGQDILEDYDPSSARIVAGSLSTVRVWPKHWYRWWKLFRWHVKDFIMSNFMENLMTFAVLFNTVCLSLDRYQIDEATSNFLVTANTIFTYVFISEMGLKIIGLGISKYLSEKMNYIDGSVVILSMVELSMSSGGGAISAFRSIRIFRTFRVIRITRLLRSMKEMTVILNALLNSLNSIMYLFMLVFLMLFIFSLIGMQIYGNSMNFSENVDGVPGVPRQNYDSFFWAFQTCFQLFTQENWQIVLADTLRSTQNKGLTMIYHIAWMTVGNTILLNLLMGIMLDSLGTEEQNEENQQKGLALVQVKHQEGLQLIEYFQQEAQVEEANSGGLGGGGKKKKKKQKNSNLLDESFEFDPETIHEEGFFSQLVKQKNQNFEGNECELSYFLFSKENPMRIFFYKMINHFGFEIFIQFFILLSSIKLVLDTYESSFPEAYGPISNGADYLFTIIFAIEFLVKSISLGFVMEEGTYLRESWNILDFFIVVASIIDASLTGVNIPIIKVLRLLRALRPLRVMSHNSNMKNVISALIHSVSGIMYVAILLFVVWIMFAILFVNLMGGKMYSCTEDPYSNFNEQQCAKKGGHWDNFDFNYDNVGIALISLFDISTMENWPDQRNIAMDISDEGTGPIRNNSMWYAYLFNVFVLIGTYIFLNLFIGVIFIKFQENQNEEIQMSGLTSRQLRWIDMMKMILSATPDLETTNIPSNKFRRKVHSFITGINFDKKSTTAGEEETAGKRASQEKKLKSKKKKSKAVLQAEQNKTINKFDLFIMGVIVANMVHLCLNFEGAGQQYSSLLDYFNYVFTIIFVVEAGLKLVAFGWSYFKNTQNVFDFFIVLANIMDVTMSFMSVEQMSGFTIGPQLARVFRVLRLFRLYRLVKKFKGLSAMMDTIVLSLPTLMSTFALLLLVYFIYAIIANFLFGEVTTGDVIDDYINFSSFGQAMMTLISTSTGEDWNYIMMDCGKTDEDGCTPGVDCGSAYNFVFFVTFEVLQGFIMLNLFVLGNFFLSMVILVITQQFDKYYMQDFNVLQLFKQDLAQFKDVWTTFTHENHCIKIKDFKIMEFFSAMYCPLGMRPEEDSDLEKELEEKHSEEDLARIKSHREDLLMRDIIKSVVKMDLDSDADGYVYFNELLFKTLKRIYGEEHEKNLIVIQEEVRCLKKIKQIKERLLRQQRQKARKQIMTVNPFVIKMFKHISFKSWLNLYKQNLDKRISQRTDLGQVSISEAEQEEEEKIEDDQYFYETENDQSCSEFEEHEGESLSVGADPLNIDNINRDISLLDEEGSHGLNSHRTRHRVLDAHPDHMTLTQQVLLPTASLQEDRRASGRTSKQKKHQSSKKKEGKGIVIQDLEQMIQEIERQGDEEAKEEQDEYGDYGNDDMQFDSKRQ